MAETLSLPELKEKATYIAQETIKLVVNEGDSHGASALSMVDILIALYYNTMNHETDKFILSKGHGCFSYYTVLRDFGFNPQLIGHPDRDESNGVWCTTGSLGHGLPQGAGMAFAKKLAKKPGHVYVVLGDGECQEGTLWEASNIAVQQQLTNLTAIIDFNGLQSLESVKDVAPFTNLPETMLSIGWNVTEIDGHNMEELLTALQKKHESKPNLIIAHTVKGKRLSFMEGKWVYQSKRVKQPNLIAQAYKELNIDETQLQEAFSKLNISGEAAEQALATYRGTQ